MQTNQSPILTPECPAEKKSSRPWNFWPTIGFGLLIGFAYVVSQIIVEGIFAVKNVISNPGISSSQLMSSLTNGNVLIAAIFMSTVIGAGFTLLFIKIRKGISFKEYLALRPIKVTTVFIAFGIVIALLIISWSTSTKEVLLAALPGRLWRGIQSRAAKLDLKRQVRHYPSQLKAWTAEDDAMLAQLYVKETSTEAVASALGRSVQAIASRAWLLRIRKPRELIHPKPKLVWEVQNGYGLETVCS